ncbi:MAG: nucleotidyltransferase, partial [Ferruginibacter sp.]|nr:nucleotidyltransferase [Ferruginibacter sp.]
DDFYGRDAFEKAFSFLTQSCNDSTAAIIGYQLDKTLSEHGTVSRGVCEVDAAGNLISITERTKIFPENNQVYYEDAQGKTAVDGTSSVSMNFWCFPTAIFSITEKLFKSFIEENRDQLKAEFFIPIVADHFIKEAGGAIRVIPTSAQWFGVTYKEDAPMVKASLDVLLEDKVYPQKLW